MQTKICSECGSKMKLIPCPDGSRKYICQNIKCTNSRVHGTYK
ncbi:MAG: hypothetical protein ACLTG7_06390 [Romboutsia sp.]|jgi:hypothetical protein